MTKLNAKLASLGIAIVGKPATAADPERTVLEAVLCFREDRKVLSLVAAWISSYGDLLHIERLSALAKSLEPEQLIWLGGLCSWAATKDRRFQKIVSLVESKVGKERKSLSTSRLDKLTAKKKGKDPHFARFGLTIPEIIPSPEKKLYARAHTLTQHPWLRLRSLFGPNWRADIAWEMLRDRTQTPYRVAQNLGCNTETAYRNWKALLEANAPALLNLA